MKKIRLKHFGHPIGQPRHKSRIIRGHLHNYDPAKKDKHVFLSLMMPFKPEKPYTGALKIEVLAYYARPASHYIGGKREKGLKPTAPIYVTKTPDWDNVGKFVCDALNGVFWLDDKVIADGRVIKMFSDNPRLDIKIEELRGL